MPSLALDKGVRKSGAGTGVALRPSCIWAASGLQTSRQKVWLSWCAAIRRSTGALIAIGTIQAGWPSIRYASRVAFVGCSGIMWQGQHQYDLDVTGRMASSITPAVLLSLLQRYDQYGGHHGDGTI